MYLSRELKKQFNINYKKQNVDDFISRNTRELLNLNIN
jgi:hypothetical protein